MPDNDSHIGDRFRGTDGVAQLAVLSRGATVTPLRLNPRWPPCREASISSALSHRKLIRRLSPRYERYSRSPPLRRS